MGRPKALVPKYCLHKSSGRAVVYIDRKSVYLGAYGSQESKELYGKLISERDLHLPPATDAARVVTVDDVCLHFEAKRLPFYWTSTGERSAEIDCYAGVTQILRDLFSEADAAKFGPLKMRCVRDVMIAKGWCRKFINKQCHRLRFIFRIAAGWELIPPEVVLALKMVEPLRPGDSSAPESEPRSAVPMQNIELMKEHLRKKNRDLVDLMLVSAARPGEILALTTEMIDASGDVWSADFEKHKTARFGHRRVLYFGTRAQQILSAYLNPAEPAARLFPTRRKTFGTAVRDACIKAGVPVFTPHWLRHTAVTMIADETDMESAQRVAGHSTAAMTELYARAADRKAKDAVKRLG